MSEGNIATPGDPWGGGDEVSGLPQIPPEAEPLAVVTVVLYAMPDGSEDIATEGINIDGGALPALTIIGMLTTGATRLALGDG